jgi:hypothetical protein
VLAEFAQIVALELADRNCYQVILSFQSAMLSFSLAVSISKY